MFNAGEQQGCGTSRKSKTAWILKKVLPDKCNTEIGLKINTL